MRPIASLLEDVSVAWISAPYVGLDTIARVFLLAWLSAASVLMFVGSLIAIPWPVIRIPTDYFLRQRHYADRWTPRHPLFNRVHFLAVKNVIGALLLLAGIIMLVTPGQGVLTILVGWPSLHFPCKFAMHTPAHLPPPGVPHSQLDAGQSGPLARTGIARVPSPAERGIRVLGREFLRALWRMSFSSVQVSVVWKLISSVVVRGYGSLYRCTSFRGCVACFTSPIPNPQSLGSRV